MTTTRERVKKPKRKRSPGPKGRITKKTGDVRSLPDEGKVDKGGKIGGKAIRHLRALGHHLDAIVQIGKEGITDGVVAATRAALLAHELVKIRVAPDAPLDRKEAGVELASRAQATLAQTLGRTLLLYKRHPHKPKIELPRG
jgi:RNA-binding protein